MQMLLDKVDARLTDSCVFLSPRHNNHSISALPVRVHSECQNRPQTNAEVDSDQTDLAQ